MNIPKELSLARLQGLAEWERIALHEILRIVNGGSPGQKAVFRNDYVHCCITSGRGFGKTVISMAWAAMQMLAKPGSHGIIISKTVEDAEKTVVLSRSTGLVKFFPQIETEGKHVDPRTLNKSRKTITLPNGSTATYVGSRDKDKLRGSNFAWAVFDEYGTAVGGIDLYKDLKVTLRESSKWGPPVRLCTSTPMINEITKAVIEDAKKPGGMLVKGSTYENKFLDKTYREDLERDFKGTPFEQREMYGILDSVPDALATPKQIEESRLDKPSNVNARILSIDPAMKDKHRGSETGIVLVSVADGHIYIESDYSTHLGLASAAEYILQLSKDKNCDILVEENQGWDLVVDNLRKAGKLMNPPLMPTIETVTSTVNKLQRAELPSLLLANGRLHFPKNMPPSLPELEDQFCSMSRSPEYTDFNARLDRVDAMSQAVKYFEQYIEGGIIGSFDS